MLSSTPRRAKQETSQFFITLTVNWLGACFQSAASEVDTSCSWKRTVFNSRDGVAWWDPPPSFDCELTSVHSPKPHLRSAELPVRVSQGWEIPPALHSEEKSQCFPPRSTYSVRPAFLFMFRMICSFCFRPAPFHAVFAVSLPAVAAKAFSRFNCLFCSRGAER